jgi:hypothetical protein
MAEQHRATDKQWDLTERIIHHFVFSNNIEVYGGIEALEAAAQPNHPAKPDSSLVERVAAAIIAESGTVGWEPEARAAIRAVAAWLRDHYGGPTATTDLLEQEAER